MSPIVKGYQMPAGIGGFIVKGYQMPAGIGGFGAFRGQASDKPQGRKPRAGIGTAVPRGELWGFEGHGQWAEA
jgi:hypothetical protein